MYSNKKKEITCICRRQINPFLHIYSFNTLKEKKMGTPVAAIKLKYC